MRLLNEYHCINQICANNVITSPFGMGEGFLNKNEHYVDLWTTVGTSTATQLLQTPPGMTKLPESSSASSSTIAAAS